MTNKTILIFLLLIPFTLLSQGFQAKSFETGIGVYTDGNDVVGYGLSEDNQFSGEIGRNIFSIDLSLGAGFTRGSDFKKIFHVFIMTSLLYSREFHIFKKFIVEPQTGVGFVNQTRFLGSEKNAVMLPIKIKLKVPLSDNLSIGVCPSAFLNKNNNIYYCNAFIEINF